MKFAVSRTSNWNEDKPCKEAFQETHYSDRFGEDINLWFIEINSLEDLIKFKEKYGKIVIGGLYELNSFNEIEIYDNLRE